MNGKRATTGRGPRKRSPKRLPERLLVFFWDYQAGRLSWERDRDLIIARILAVGDLKSVQWVRSRMGDEALREWLLKRKGAGLSPPQLRFWELILDLPHREVNTWLAHPARQAWDQRWR
jgi:hypothetical protein